METDAPAEPEGRQRLMTQELTVVAWGCLLALVYIFSASIARTSQYGVRWNMGPRDQALAQPLPIVGRLTRAQANYFETFPIVIAAALILAVTGRDSPATAAGAWLWFISRIVYLPLYALGVPVVRSLVFMASLAGIILMLWPALL